MTFQFVRIEPGGFEMGSPPDELGRLPNEGPPRRVKISKPFYLGRHEVTQVQYEAVMGVNPSRVRGESLPLSQLKYSEAIEFCKRLSTLVGFEVMLPTEAQWEFAARAGTTTPVYSGILITDLDRVAWYRANSGGTIHPVGQKQPNAWGLYDVLGNVWEFTADFLPAYDRISDTDPVGEISRSRGVMRGGGWMHGSEYSRAASRLISDDMFGGAGIRLAINPH